MGNLKPETIRNVVLLGHGSSGKTSLSEALLFDTGTTSRLGSIDEKNTVSDYDEEEHSRGLSVNLSVLPCDWDDTRMNLLDPPGYTDFIGEVLNGIRAADSAVLVLCAASGVEVGAELQWQYADEAQIPRMVFINKMDRDNASFERTLEQLSAKFDVRFVPITMPMGAFTSFSGVVDLMSMKAYVGDKGEEQDIPAEIRDDAEAARMQMMEYAAESDDELMLKYLDDVDLTDEEIAAALAKACAAGEAVPVLAGSATKNIGVKQLLDAISHFLPSPVEAPFDVTDRTQEEMVSLEPKSTEPLVVQVFKTLADPFVGKLTYFRVFSGTISSDSRVFNMNKDEEERLGQLFMVRGKEQMPVDQVTVGDLGAVAKLDVTITGDTLSDRGTPYVMPPIEYPEPLYSVAVFPKTKADLDKLGTGLGRLVEEDPTLRVERNSETNEMILSGMGDSHIQIAARHLASKFGVEILTQLPTIAYRETITKVAQSQGRHKKQTGGRGQFGDVWIRFEPQERGEGFVFESEIFGGSVPRQYVPAVEKGLREIMEQGVVAGYPTVDFKAVIYDGSYHSVDSSEMAFKLASHLAFRNGIPQAGPVLLEPVYDIRVTVPEEHMGDILGDLNTRRGRVQGMENVRGNGVVTAQVPLAEIQRYATDLRSMTQGRGYFSMSFSHYDIVPNHLVEAIAKEAEEKRQSQ